MRPKIDQETVEQYKRFVSRRDSHVRQIKRDPAKSVPSGKHVSLAILEAWLEGKLTDAQVRKYMHKYDRCDRCQAVYKKYEALKNNGSTRARKLGAASD